MYNNTQILLFFFSFWVQIYLHIVYGCLLTVSGAGEQKTNKHKQTKQTFAGCCSRHLFQGCWHPPCSPHSLQPIAGLFQQNFTLARQKVENGGWLNWSAILWLNSSCICPSWLTDNPIQLRSVVVCRRPRGLWLWLSALCMLPTFVTQITKQMRPVNFIIQRDRSSFGDERQ